MKGAAYPWAGAILAGGLSSRMGSPKPGVRLADGTPMLEHVLEVLAGLCPLVLVAGDSAGYDTSRCANVRRVSDLRTGLGPLAGIEALLASGVAEGYLVVGCDQPGLTKSLLLPLAGGSCGTFYGSGPSHPFHPLPGHYPSSWLRWVQTRLDRGQLSLRALVESQDVAWVPVPANGEARLRSLNTPGDVSVFNDTMSLGAHRAEGAT